MTEILSRFVYVCLIYSLIIPSSLALEDDDGECSFMNKYKYLKSERDEENCGYMSRLSSCLPGFYADLNGKLATCPPGYFCPAEFICKIKCLDGSYCPSVKLDSTGYNCLPYNQAPFRNESVELCGGAFNITFCESGYYCSTPTKKEICPEGYFCIAGSQNPSICPPISHCPEGTSWPTSWGLSVLILSIGFILPVLIGKLYYRLRDKHLLKKDEELDVIRRSVMMDVNHENGRGPYSIDVSPAEYTSDLLSPSIRTMGNNHNSHNQGGYVMDIEFQDVSLTIDKTKSKVLENVSGKFVSGNVTAVMGPSGSGKTSLINVLTNKADYGHVTGNILINGKEIDSMELYAPWMGFVPQEDIMHRNFTVQETLLFYANLRLPISEDKLHRELIVQEVLRVLGIYEIRHSRIGGINSEERGISGGQRKRVNIGMELVSNPSLLFLDEPTSGLDSTSSYEVIHALRQIAASGVTVIVVLHQPRAEVFRLFDDVCLLLNGGKLAYCGSRSEAVPFFVNLGYKYNHETNPADFLIDTISCRPSPYEPNPLYTEIQLQEKWINYRNTLQNSSFIRSSNQHTKYKRIKRRELPGFWIQLRRFTWRSFVQLVRSPVSQLLDFGLVAVAGLGLGLLFHTRTIEDTTSIALLTSLTIGMTTTMSGVRLFGNERVIYYREISMGINPLAYFLGKNFASAYMHILSPACFLATFYALITPRATFFELYGVIYAATLACSGIAEAVSILFNEKNMQLAGVVTILLLNMVAGTNPTICKLNDMSFIPLIAVNISYARFFVDALVVLELNGWPYAYKYIIQEMHDHYCFEEYGVGWDISLLVLIGILTRIFAFIFMITIEPNRKQSFRNAGKIAIALGVGLLIAGIVVGAIIGIAYLILSQTS